jgi:hypothetical protein
MKRLFLALLVFAITTAYGQTMKDTKDQKDPKEKKAAKNIYDGYEGVAWGTRLTAARDTIKGKLYFTDEKSLILSRDGELDYHYGFFYQDPAMEKADSAEAVKKEGADKQKEGTDKSDEGKLFYVALKFPYLSMDEVRKKIEEKFGPATTENMNKNQGAIAWNGEKTIVIMWVDRYENKPYCRRITYVSKEITRELNDYQIKVFNRVELELIRKLNP